MGLNMCWAGARLGRICGLIRRPGLAVIENWLLATICGLGRKMSFIQRYLLVSSLVEKHSL